MKTSLFRFVFEIALWSIANLLCMGLATGAVYLVGTNLLGWGPAYLSFFLPVTALLSSSWGSWSSMVWARNRGVRIGMYISAGIPGALMTALGIFGFYVGFGAWFIWAGFALGGLAMIAVTATLCRRFNPRTHTVPALSSVYGLVLHPILTLAATGGIASIWYSYVTTVQTVDWRNLISFATMMTTLLAVAMITTVIPAATSTLCRKLALENGKKMSK